MGQVRVHTSIELIDSKGFSKKHDYVYNNNVLNSYYEHFAEVSASSTAVIWDPNAWTGYTPADFDFMALISNTELHIEFTVNEGDANEELFTFELLKDLPILLGSKSSYYNHSASDAYGGTLDVIDKIRAKEVNGNDAKLHVILFT